MGQYTIQAICQQTGISQQTFYRLARDDEDFRALVETDRKKKRNRYLYGDSVVEWLRDRYSNEKTDVGMIEDARDTPAKDERDADLDDSACETLAEEDVTESESSSDDCEPVRESRGDRDISVLEREIESLHAQLAIKDGEIKSLFAQNSQLILLLSEEKMEKQALLPAPKKPILERIKQKFSK